ncbi:hypothetical protein ABPG74_022419 [Tetrahymena malaccensis]
MSSLLLSSSKSSKAPQSKKKGSLDIQYIINASKGRDEWESIEQNINDWLDEQNICIVDPFQKQQQYYQSQKLFAFEEIQREDSSSSSSSSGSSSNSSSQALSPVLNGCNPKEFSLEIKSNLILERRGKFNFSNFF